MTRRSELKAMREALAGVKALAESDAGKEHRETLRRLSESDMVKKFREAFKGFPAVDRSAVIAVPAEAKEALAWLQETEDEVVAPAPRRRNKGGRPADHDWPGAKKHLDDWVLKNGLPEVRTRLVELAEAWFKKFDGGAAPHAKDIMKKLVKPLYNERRSIPGGKPPR
jgi:hypothetical protein